MKLRWFILLGMLAVGLFSSALTVYFLKADPTLDRSTFEGGERSLNGPVPTPSVFPALAVIDDTRSVLNFEEQKALFAGLTNHLNDPASAQLRLLRRAKNKLTVCGELNARNKFGGYVGFVPFAGVIAGATAVITMPTRDVAVSMPSEILASFEKLGCSDAPTVTQTSDPKKEITLGPMDQFSGNVTSVNSDEFTAFIGRNSGKLVKLSVYLKSNETGDLEVWGNEKGFHAFTRFSKINAASGFQYEKGAFTFDGNFFVEYVGVVEGAVYELRHVQGSLMRSGIGLSR